MPDGALQARAIRMLRAGDPPKLVAQTTGLVLTDVEQLQRDTPGLTRPAAPATASVPQQPGEPTSCGHIVELPTRVLTEHPANIRSNLGDPDELEDLAQSIRTQGVLQPLVVMRRDRQYILLAGHRRLAAADMVGLARVPVTIRDTRDDAASIEAMLVENLHRAGLDPIDEAHAYQALLNTGRTTTQIAKAVGKNVGTISQRLALLNLTPAEQQAIRDKTVSVHQGYLTGRDRSTRRRPHDTHRPKPKTIPHFTKKHPLAGAAAARCDHDTLLKLGVACGPCWEATIRADEQRRADGWPA